MAPGTVRGRSTRPTRAQLQSEIRSVLPDEGMEYVRELNTRRFGRHAGADQLFFKPEDLVTLLAQVIIDRGSLEGDDRQEMIAAGVSAEAFELPDTYQYLKVRAEGRLGLLPIEELPHWVPVTLRAEPEPHTRIGFRRARPRSDDKHLTFTIDADFQRMANYATVILAPNWFGDDPTTARAVPDVFLGPPVPSAMQAIASTDELAQRMNWQDGSELQVHELRALLPGRPLWLSCRNRNLPGT